MSVIGATGYKLLPRRLFNALRVLKYPELVLRFENIKYNQDGLVTAHNADFLRDERFARAYKKGDETGSWIAAKIHWRALVACWAAERGKTL